MKSSKILTFPNLAYKDLRLRREWINRQMNSKICIHNQRKYIFTRGTKVKWKTNWSGILQNEIYQSLAGAYVALPSVPDPCLSALRPVHDLTSWRNQSLGLLRRVMYRSDKYSESTLLSQTLKIQWNLSKADTIGTPKKVSSVWKCPLYWDYY